MNAITNNFSENALDTWQFPSGQIVSYVTRGKKSEVDSNLFFTALWLRELRLVYAQCYFRDIKIKLARLKNKAIDFLVTCPSSKTQFGAYAFWQGSSYPCWAGRIACDIDDTAIINHELYLSGKVSAKQIRAKIYPLLQSLRVSKYRSDTPLWVVPGCYYTWISAAPNNQNVVDACVNVNVIALLASLDSKTAPGYHCACEMVIRAIEWARADRRRLKAITPFYPSPYELYFALDHAISCGADELIPALLLLNEIGINEVSYFVDQKENNEICSNFLGRITWSCDAIETLRKIRFSSAKLVRDKYLNSCQETSHAHIE